MSIDAQLSHQRPPRLFRVGVGGRDPRSLPGRGYGRFDPPRPGADGVGGATASGPTWEMAGEIFLLRVPRLARFRITAGRDIDVETEPGVSDHEVAGFVLGTAFGILLHQRGALVLHGAAVAKRRPRHCDLRPLGRRQIDTCGGAVPRRLLFRHR